MDLADAARLVCARGALMAACRADGAMASVEATEAEVLELVGARSDQLSVAGLNGPTQTVVSGDGDAVADVVRHFDEQGRRTRALQVSRAFHSPHMDAALEEFGEVARSCTFRAPRVPVVSTLTADLLPPPDRLAEHWVEQLRGPVPSSTQCDAWRTTAWCSTSSAGRRPCSPPLRPPASPPTRRAASSPACARTGTRL